MNFSKTLLKKTDSCVLFLLRRGRFFVTAGNGAVWLRSPCRRLLAQFVRAWPWLRVGASLWHEPLQVQGDLLLNRHGEFRAGRRSGRHGVVRSDGGGARRDLQHLAQCISGSLLASYRGSKDKDYVYEPASGGAIKEAGAS